MAVLWRTSWIALVLLGLVSQSAQQCTESVIDLTFVLDGSGSICDNDDGPRFDDGRGCNNWQSVVSFVSQFIQALSIGPDNSHVGIVTFANEGQTFMTLDQFSDSASMVDYVENNLNYPGGNTATQDGLDTARTEVFGQGGDRSGARNIVVLVTDGIPTLPDPEAVAREAALQAATELKLTDVQIFSIGVTDLIDISFLQDVSTGGVENQDWFTSATFDGLQEILDTVISQTCVTTPAPPSECDESVIDLAFIVDGSGSICDNDEGPKFDDGRGCNNWLSVVSFVQSFVQALTIGSDNSHVGIVTFANEGQTFMTLDQFTDRTEMVDYIENNLNYPGGNTATQDGLDTARTEIFGQSGDRSNVRNVAIVITDGIPTLPEPEATARANALAAAQSLRGVAQIFAVGVTELIDMDFLRDVSTGGIQDENWFTSATFEGLQEIRDSVISQTCATPAPSPPSGCETSVIDLTFVLDGSGSICDNDDGPRFDDGRGCNNWQSVVSFVNSFVEALSIGDELTRVGIVTFANEGSTLMTLNQFNTAADITTFVTANLNYPGGNTATKDGLDTARTEVFNQAGDRAGVRNVIVVMTDGIPTLPEPDSNARSEALAAAQTLKNEGATIYAVGVTDNIDRDFLRDLSSGGVENDDWFTSTTFEGLQEIRDQVVSQTCASDCRISADVVFILDSSGSIRRDNFALVVTFLSELVDNLDIDRGVIRVGLIQFATEVQLAFHLDRYTTKEEIRAHIEGLSYTRGRTNTAEALDYVQNNMFAGTNGDREGVINMAVILTDGGSSDKEATFLEATQARRNMHILVMALGSWIDEYELKAIASDGYNENLIFASVYSELSNFISTMENKICNNINECASNPCQNGGTCFDSIDKYYCECPSPFAGPNCEYTCRVPSDVVFAVDSSGSIGKENFQTIMDFTKKVASYLPLDGGAKVALETFSTNERMYFELKDNEGVVQTMDAMTIPYFQGGSTHTDRALEYMRQNMFTSDNGDQSARPNVGIVITDGYSTDRDATWKEAMDNRADGIHMVSIGVTNSIRESELRSIASYPTESNMFMVPDFNSLDSIMSDVADAMCNAIDECASDPCQNGGVCRDVINGYFCECTESFTGRHCERSCAGSADILFVIDRSGSIRHEVFEDVTEALANLVGEMELFNNKVRVAAISFSDDATLEFDLDDYQSQQDVMEAIRNIQWTGGRTNIASALQMAREQALTPGRGDRENSPNYVFLFSDGSSNVREIDTVPEAIDLRIAGATVIDLAVGRDLDMMELRGIASEPVNRNVLTVNSFTQLATIIAAAVQRVCNDVDECASDPCQNGGTCVDGLGRYECTCPGDFTGRNCERSCTRQMDLLFAMDLSGSVDNVYNETIAIVEEILYGLETRQDNARAALIAFADDAEVRFYFDTYQDKRDMIQALSFSQLGGRTNTQEALRQASDSVFVESRGDRAGVDNVLVLLTDGGSNVNPLQTVQRAQTLRDRGVNIHVVSIGDQVDMSEVNDIVSSPLNVHTVNNPEQGIQAAQDILNALCA